MPKRQSPRRKARKGPRPVLPVITPDEAIPEVADEAPAQPELVVQAPVARTAVAMPGAPARPMPGPVVRHITRDHRYVISELKRAGVTIALVIGGLILAAAFMRWF